MLGPAPSTLRAPSFAAGFARSKAESAYPRLWDGLMHAWCPSLGAQGSVLIDPVARHDATLNSGATWTTWQRGIALDLDGSTGYVELITTGLRFDPVQGTIVVTAAIDAYNSNKAIWILRADGNNEVEILPLNTTTYRWKYGAGGVSKTVSTTSISADANRVRQFALTWSKPLDEVRAYLDGLQLGTTQTGLGTWAGSLAFARIGKDSSIDVHNGRMGDGYLFSRALSPAEIAAMWAGASPLHLRPRRRRFAPEQVAGGGTQPPRSMHQFRLRRAI